MSGATHRRALLALQAKVVGDGLVIFTLVVGGDKDKLSLEGLGNSAQSSEDRGSLGQVGGLGPDDELLLDARVEDLVRCALAELDRQGHLLGRDESLELLTTLEVTRVGSNLASLVCG